MSHFQPKISPDDALLKSQLDALKQKAGNKKELKKAAEQFESLFIYYMLKTMRKTIPKSGLFGKGLGDEIMQSMFDEKLSEEMALNTRLGIAEMVYQQLSGEEDSPQSPELKFEWRRFPGKVRGVSQRRAEQFWLQEARRRVARFDRYIVQAAGETGLDPDLIRAVILTESGGNPRAVSPKNAKGLMQLMDSTAAELGVENPLDPEQNIRGGARYLAQLLNRFQGDFQKALAAYNAGPNNVEKYRGIPPFKETQHYVNRVQQLYRKLKKRSPLVKNQ